jgi:hypothetical protein
VQVHRVQSRRLEPGEPVLRPVGAQQRQAQQVGRLAELLRRLRRAERRHRRPADQLGLAAVPGAVAEADRVVQTLGDHVDLVVVGQDAQIDERMGEAEGGQAFEQRPDHERAHGADREHLAHPAGFELLEQPVDGAEGLEQRGRKPQAFVGQRQSSVGAAEQGHAEPLFEALHLMADRRLCHAQLIGRAGE